MPVQYKRSEQDIMAHGTYSCHVTHDNNTLVCITFQKRFKIHNLNIMPKSVE